MHESESADGFSLTQECFNSPYGTGFFASYAERIPGESTQVLSEVAKENKVYLVGGEVAAEKRFTEHNKYFSALLINILKFISN